jgi:hypothetical protein
MYYGTDKMAFLLNVSVLGQRFEMNYVPDIISGLDIEMILLSGILRILDLTFEFCKQGFGNTHV